MKMLFFNSLYKSVLSDEVEPEKQKAIFLELFMQ